MRAVISADSAVAGAISLGRLTQRELVSPSVVPSSASDKASEEQPS